MAIGMARHGTGMVRYGVVWCVMVWSAVVWSGGMWCGVVWCAVFGLVCRLLWYSMVPAVLCFENQLTC